MTSDAIVHIHGFADSEPGLLGDVLERLRRFENVAEAHIYVQPRKPESALSDPGWAEYLTQLSFTDGGKLTLGCIQRKPGMQTEFHS